MQEQKDTAIQHVLRQFLKAFYHKKKNETIHIDRHTPPTRSQRSHRESPRGNRAPERRKGEKTKYLLSSPFTETHGDHINNPRRDVLFFETGLAPMSHHRPLFPWDPWDRDGGTCLSA